MQKTCPALETCPALAILVGLLWLAGCGHTRYFEVDRVTPTDTRSFWVAGSEGLAGFYDGFQMVRHDYPMVDGANEYAYAFGGRHIPIARVVMDDRVPHLFTRHADILRFDGLEWQPLDVKLPGDQINAVMRTPEGGLLIVMHSDLLLWTSFGQLAAGQWRATRAPTFFQWLGFIDGQLYGIGFDEGGNRLAIAKRVNKKWRIVGRVTHGDGFREPVGMVRLHDGSLAAFGSSKVAIINEELDQNKLLELSDWLSQQQLLDMTKLTKSQVYLSRLIVVDGLAPLLFVGANQSLVIELGQPSRVHEKCHLDGYRVVGAIADEAGEPVLVGRQGGLWSLDDGKCHVLSPASIPIKE